MRTRRSIVAVILLAVVIGLLVSGCGWRYKEPVPVITILPSPPYMPGQVLTFDGSNSYSKNPGGHITNRHWEIIGPDGLYWTKNQESFSKALPRSGTYQITLKVTDNYQKSKRSEIYYLEVQQIELHLDFKMKPEHPSEGDLVTFTGFLQLCSECTEPEAKSESYPQLDWEWDFEGVIKQGRIVEYVFEDGQHQVTLSVTDPRTGAQGTTSKIIDIATRNVILAVPPQTQTSVGAPPVEVPLTAEGKTDRIEIGKPYIINQFQSSNSGEGIIPVPDSGILYNPNLVEFCGLGKINPNWTVSWTGGNGSIQILATTDNPSPNQVRLAVLNFCPVNPGTTDLKFTDARAYLRQIKLKITTTDGIIIIE